MKRHNILFPLLMLVTTLFSAKALEINFHGATPIKNKFLLGASTLSMEDGLSPIRPIRVSGSIAGIGRFKGIFSQAQVFSDSLVTFRGSVKVKSGEFPLSASYFKSINSLSLFFTDTSRAVSGRRAYAIEVRVPLLPEEDAEQLPAEVLRTPLSNYRAPCGQQEESTIPEDPATPDELDTSGDEEAKKIKTHILSARRGSASSNKIIQMSLILDPGAVTSIQQRGYSPSDYVNSIVNSANTILSKQMKYTIKISSVTPLDSDPFSTNVSNDLLKSFALHKINNQLYGDVDLYHLFTSRDLDSNTIGIAYTGGLCNNIFLRFSLTQLLPLSLHHIVFAHEIGHNMGAGHDESGKNTIMAPALNASTPPTKFSKTSIKQIKKHLSGEQAQCVKNDSVNVLPAVIGERSPSPDDSSKYKASFYLSTNLGQSAKPYQMSVDGRPISIGSKFSRLYTSPNPIYGLNFTSQQQAQYRALITDGARSRTSAILTIPVTGARLTLRKSGNTLVGSLSGISSVYPATIEIINRSNKRSTKVISTIKTDPSGNFSVSIPAGTSKVAARWFYNGSHEALYSKVVK